MVRICLSQQQRLGNRIAQQLAGIALSRRLNLDFPHGFNTPEVGIPVDVCKCNDSAITLDRHQFDLYFLEKVIQTKMFNRIHLRGWGMRLEYLIESRDTWLKISDVQNQKPIHKITEDEVAIHIRLGDALTGQNPWYYPLPISYYEKVLDDINKSPVFIGEFGSQSDYEHQLKSSFVGARFVQSSAFDDWLSLLHAPTKIVSNSSFAWTAAWLGKDDTRVHLPVAGIFHPIMHPTIDLIPWEDPRYEFRWLAPLKRLKESPLDKFLLQLERDSNDYPKLI